jgi:hypothetical protein
LCCGFSQPKKLVNQNYLEKFLNLRQTPPQNKQTRANTRRATTSQSTRIPAKSVLWSCLMFRAPKTFVKQNYLEKFLNLSQNTPKTSKHGPTQEERRPASLPAFHHDSVGDTGFCVGSKPPKNDLKVFRHFGNF